ncbi:PRC-barrel domain-containing protein [Patescibacteria group bacterium]|nr:PRC-barrel domain-containing protein [Patescibacteria group bacterium]MBU0964043.1 PRC-barrel domain-containing protein [Patescibacteria group bacterium]
MRLNKEQLIGLPVYTQSRQYLGKVVDFDFDTALQFITHYHVKSKDIIKGLLKQELLISKEQVVAISSEEMLVIDSLITEPNEKRQVVRKAVPA